MPNFYNFAGSFPKFDYFHHLDANTTNFVNSATVGTVREVVALQYEKIIDQVAVNEGIFDTAIRSDTRYVIDGSITIPSGTNIILNDTVNYITGLGLYLSGIVCTEAGATLFTAPDGCGQCFINNCFISVTGIGAKVYNLTDATGTKNMIQQNVLYLNCTSLGTLGGFLQGLEESTARLGGTPSLLFTGAWTSGYLITNSIARSLTNSTYSIFECDSGMTFGSRFKGNPNFEIPSSVTGFTIAESNFNDGAFQLKEAIFSGAGAVLNDSTFTTSRKSLISSCVGLATTIIGGSWRMTTPAATTLTLANTIYKMTGTTTDYDMTWFEMTANNTVKLITSLDVGVNVYFSGSFTSSASNTACTARLMFWDDSAGAYLDADTCHTDFTTNSSSRAENVSLFSRRLILSQNDRIEVWVESTSAGVNVTAANSTQLTVLVFG